VNLPQRLPVRPELQLLDVAPPTRGLLIRLLMALRDWEPQPLERPVQQP
jgi:hypothetical protein